MSLKIGVIVGSTRPNRVGRKVADWFMEQVQDMPDVEFELIDLAEVNLPFLDEPKTPDQGDYQHEHTKKWSKIIDPLDGYILVTPEYNRGYPAALKNALDTIYNEWGHKPVGFVGYGGLGATRAIQQLIQVTAHLDMVPLSMPTVNIINLWEAFDDQGKLKPEFTRGNPQKLVEKLLWWANLLKPTRSQKAE
jgi:NAD(P)H-dependent FMN reductase